MSAATLTGSTEVVIAVVALGLIAWLALWRDAFRRRCARRWRMEDAASSETASIDLARRASLRPARPERVSRRWIGLGWRPVLMIVAALATAAAAVLSAWRSGSPALDMARSPTAIVFALDVSRSMEVADVPPSRLQVARSLAARIAGEAAPGSVGLVAFAGETELICPLTSDLDAFNMALDEVPSVMGTLAGGSAIAEALTRSASTFGQARGRKLVVMLSDGEDTGTAGAFEAVVKRLSAERVTVITIGLGTPAGASMPVRRPDPSGMSGGDASGQRRVARLDAPRLQRLARSTGGEYYDGAGVDTAARLVSRLRAPASYSRDAGQQSGFSTALLAGAFLCLALEWLTGIAGGRSK